MPSPCLSTSCPRVDSFNSPLVGNAVPQLPVEPYSRREFLRVLKHYARVEEVVNGEKKMNKKSEILKAKTAPRGQGVRVPLNASVLA